MPETKPPRTLRAIVLDLIESTDLADPREIASTVLAQSTQDEIYGFLLDSLATEVRSILGEHRKSPLPPSWRPAQSAKVSAIRDAWQALLAGRYSVGGTWKALADFTAEDAEMVAAERRRQSVEALVWAERFDLLAATIRAAGVTKAAELSAAPIGWLS